ncbi:MAG: S41 family peptidase [Candidatus Sungbacteria bacterium]|nr:S41 family peptidase [Candidatus Sungbacteria bacterium]
METPPSPGPASSPKRTSRVLIGILLLIIGAGFGRWSVPIQGTQKFSDQQLVVEKNGERQLVFPTFWEAWDKLHELYIGDLDNTKLLYGAIAGMVRAADDPYTSFSDPEDAKLLTETLEGSFSGVGIEIGLKNGLVTVISPLDGSPAKKAGIMEGDIIVAVDKQPLTDSLTIDQVVQKIRGQKGTTVTLTVVPKESGETKDISMVRDKIVIESVKWKIEDGVGIITVNSFNGDTSQRFTAAAKDMVRQNAAGIIIDLRGNPGGYLDTAVEIASQFLDPGKTVVQEKGKTNKEYKSKGVGLLKAMPVVVLVDGGSASASEILAGALRDQKNTPIIGQKTFGKGVVQELIQLNDGSSLKVTIAKWFTPKGNSINEEGIEPTVAVKQDRETDADEQLIKAKEELQKLTT